MRLASLPGSHCMEGSGNETSLIARLSLHGGNLGMRLASLPGSHYMEGSGNEAALHTHTCTHMHTIPTPALMPFALIPHTLTLSPSHTLTPQVTEDEVLDVVERVLQSPQSSQTTREYAINAVMKLSIR